MIKTFIKRSYLERLVLDAKSKGYSMKEISEVIDNLGIEVREG